MKGEIKIPVPMFEVRSLEIMLRDKKDIINLLLTTLSLFKNRGLFGEENEKALSKKEIIYINFDMKRVFYELKDKIFSLHFPFTIEEEIEHSKSKLKVTATSILIIKEVIKNVGIVNSYEDFYFGLNQEDGVEYLDAEINIAWGIYFELIALESGYLRYDHDPIHVNGDYHPLNHLDIFYENTATFKVGLDKRINKSEFIDILDLRTECLYLR